MVKVLPTVNAVPVGVVDPVTMVCPLATDSTNSKEKDELGSVF